MVVWFLYTRVRVTVTRIRLRVSRVLVRVASVGLVLDAVVDVENGKVTDDKEDSSWQARRSPAIVVLIPVDPDVSGWVTGVAVWNGEFLLCARVLQGVILWCLEVDSTFCSGLKGFRQDNRLPVLKDT